MDQAVALEKRLSHPPPSMQPADSNARIVVFDGICHLCSGGVRFLARHPIEPPFKLIPMQSCEGRELLIQHGIDPEDPTTFLVLDRGLVLTESDASIHIMAAIGGLWKLLVVARVIPRPWRDWLYRLLARNRYRWFGRRDTCYLPR
jgi:predicted DCC family thiol-disulfide oxidoreductase YuxK